MTGPNTSDTHHRRLDDGIAPRRSFARLGVVERQSSPTDDDDARLRFARTMAGPRLGLNLSAMHGDEVRKQVAEVAKALYRRTDQLAVLLARAITRRSGSSPLMFGYRRRGGAADGVHAAQHRLLCRVMGGCVQ
jgi:hypothetical protein